MRWNARRAIQFLAAQMAGPRGEVASPAASPRTPLQEAEGTIQSVNPISRELDVRICGETVSIYAPLDCLIVLNDERVKLRLLQPMDQAKLLLAQEIGTLIAHSIVVHWEFPPSESQESGGTKRPVACPMELP